MEFTTRTKEKRDFIRVKIDSMVTFSYLDDPTPVSARCMDLSGAGMQLETAKRLNPGDRLCVTIPSPADSLPPFRAHCRVIWTRQLDRTSAFRSGMYIERMHDQP